MSQIELIADDQTSSGRGVRRQVFERSWVIGVVAFTLLRLLVARETLAQYGLNLWVFGIIDLLTAVPYALGVARVVGACVDRRASTAGWWVVVAGISFIAPYGYVAFAGQGAAFPTSVYVVLAVVMVTFGANAVWGAARKVRRGRGPRAGS